MDARPSDEELVQQAADTLKLYKARMESTEWKKKADKPCLVETMTVEGRTVTRGRIEVPYAPEQILEFLQKEDTMKKLNEYLLKKETLHHLPEKEIKVLHMHIKGMGPCSDRDAVNVASVHRADGRIYMLAKETNFGHPETKGVVRSKCNISGYMMEKTEKGAVLSNIHDVDFMGSIPGFVKNMISEKTGTVVSRIKELMAAEGYK